jgi:general secretion pathway protein D
MKLNYAVTSTVVILLSARSVMAVENRDDPGLPTHAPPVSMPTVPLADILDAVSEKSGSKFLIDRRAQPELVIGRLRPQDVDYPALLVILRNNDLAAVTIGEFTNIVAGGDIRQYALPVLYEDDDRINGEEWVTRVIQLENAAAPSLVPVMRPLLPRAGHLAPIEESNTILIVDRYANVQRIVGMIRRMDVSTPPPPAR